MTAAKRERLSNLQRLSDDLRAEEKARGEVIVERRSELLTRLERAGVEARDLLFRNLLRHADAVQRVSGFAAAVPFARRAVELVTSEAVPGRPYLAADALWLACRYCFEADQPRDAIRFADRLVTTFDNIAEVADKIAGALFIKSNCLGIVGAGADAQVEVLDSLIERFGDRREVRIQRLIALSLYKKGELLETSDDPGGADVAWGTVFMRFRFEPPAQIEWVPFRAQERRIKIRLATGDIDQAAPLVQELVVCSDRVASDEALIEVARTLLRTGVDLERGGNLAAALPLFEWTSARLVLSPEPRLARLRVRAAINAGVVHAKLGDGEAATATMKTILSSGQAALETLEDVASEARNTDSHVPSERELWAVVLKGLVLRSLGRHTEARDAFISVVAEFSETDSEIARQLVGVAQGALEEQP